VSDHRSVSGASQSRRYHLRRDELADAPFDLVLTPKDADWVYSGLRILSLGAGESARFDTDDSEVVVMSLEGSCDVTSAGTTLTVQGRDNVFAGASDFVYVPRDSTVEVSSRLGGRFAIPSAVCDEALAMRHQPAEAVPIELRGAGQASRQVNNFCTPDAFAASKLIACEVLTPAGNWSSYPPHKHDEAREGESELEEIYYFEVASGPTGEGIGYQRVYGHASAEIDVLAEVRSGDAVVIPHGWHGPSMAAPGYDLYYLNVMAGPAAERAWLICDDPQHAWIRDTWADQDIDPRLPFSADTAGAAR
jgi:5-deoxy-glucuronate isomerase